MNWFSCISMLCTRSKGWKRRLHTRSVTEARRSLEHTSQTLVPSATHLASANKTTTTKQLNWVKIQPCKSQWIGLPHNTSEGVQRSLQGLLSQNRLFFQTMQLWFKIMNPARDRRRRRRCRWCRWWWWWWGRQNKWNVFGLFEMTAMRRMLHFAKIFVIRHFSQHIWQSARTWHAKRDPKTSESVLMSNQVPNDLSKAVHRGWTTRYIHFEHSGSRNKIDNLRENTKLQSKVGIWWADQLQVARTIGSEIILKALSATARCCNSNSENSNKKIDNKTLENQTPDKL